MRLLSIVAFLLVPSVAAADVVPPPDPTISCPDGAESTTNHCGTICVPDTCADASDCEAGQVCRTVSLCTERIPCGGFGFMVDRVHAACGAGACAMGTCMGFSVCAAPDVDAGSPGMDAGSSSDASVDSGSGASDSGTAETDSGTTETDSGTTGTDSGSGGVDSGSPGVDSGTGAGDDDGGCDCRAAGSSSPGWVWALLGLLWIGRRRLR